MTAGIVAASAVSGSGPSTFAALMASLGLDWWGRFGEASGATTLTDAAGGHNGTWTGSPTLGVAGLITGDSDTAVTLDGTGAQYGNVPYGSWLNRTTGLSMGVFYKTTDTGINYLLQRWGAAGGSQVFGLDLQASNVARGYIRTAAVNRILAPSVTGLRNGSKHLLAIDWDGSTLRLLSDGAQVDSVAAAGTPQNPLAGDLEVGRRSAGTASDSMNGTLDEGWFGPSLTLTQHAAIWSNS